MISAIFEKALKDFQVSQNRIISPDVFIIHVDTFFKWIAENELNISYDNVSRITTVKYRGIKVIRTYDIPENEIKAY